MANGLLQTTYFPKKNTDWQYTPGTTPGDRAVTRSASGARAMPSQQARATQQRTPGVLPTYPEGQAPTSGETTRGQMESLLDSDSVYLQRARARAAEQSAARGLQNSSIGAGAGEAAAIDAALPIASQDAAQSWQRGERIGEQDWRTGERIGEQEWQSGERQRDRSWQTGERQDTQHWETRERQDRQHWDTRERQDTQRWETNERQDSQNWQMRRDAELARLDRETQVILKRMDNANAVKLAQLQGQIAQASQRDGNAAAMYQTGLQSMTAILNNPNMTPAQQQAAIDNVIAGMQRGINFVQSI